MNMDIKLKIGISIKTHRRRIKDKKEFTKIGKNVDTEREKELKKEIETEGGEFYAKQSYGKIKDFI